MKILKKTSLLIAVPLFALIGHACAQDTDTLRRKDAGGWEFVQVRAGNRVTVEGNKLNGKQEGVWTIYWDNGFPHRVTTYKAGVRNGVALQTTRDGVLEMAENYKDDLLEGPRRTYKKGLGTEEETYFSEGKKSGSYVKRYDNGKIQEEGNYNNDVRDGKTTWYFETGLKAAEYNYRQGVIDGDVTIYHKNGKVSEFGQYAGDSQAGTWKEYYDNGQLKNTGSYKNGEKEGVWQQYKEDGTAGKPVNYKKGVAKK